MCPIWPLHFVVLYLLALCPMWAVCQLVPYLTADFNPDAAAVMMGEHVRVNVALRGFNSGVKLGDDVRFNANNTRVATIDDAYQLTQQNVDTGTWKNNVTVSGEFIGYTEVRVAVRTAHGVFYAPQTLRVTVVRPKRTIDTVFTYSVATLVALISINFGCAMHWPTVKAVVKRPIGPLIGMCGQFLFMPICSYVLGLLLFPDNAEMRLGMFFTGVSPGGGASNIWTFILGGNLNLSLAMTTISTLCSFGLIPAWLFSLGRVIFADAHIKVPYHNIGAFVFGLVVPMGIGLGMQRWTPRVATFMVKILKGFSSLLLSFIIVFAIVANLYIFELFSWRIIIAGMGLPWLGYGFGYVLARSLQQSHPDALAISIDTGIQNTGISIFLLRFALPQPASDLTTVVPVSVALMTPVPMMCIFFYQKVKGCINKHSKHMKILNDEVSTPFSDPENKVSMIDVVDS